LWSRASVCLSVRGRMPTQLRYNTPAVWTKWNGTSLRWHINATRVTLFISGSLHWRHLANTTEPSAFDGDAALLWPPYVIGQTIIFLPCGFFLSFFFSSPISGRRLDVYHTSTHGPSANVECRCEMCCARLAGNARSKKNRQLEMWANVQRDGRPAEHRRRPLFNAAKFG